ncbi:hypothetical protein KP509_16G055100 [Ceratopteris richardii]|uniref:Secreted protein n=1 Tax=Ceratopteris richardii TaxID=49495 RepID=A0A8T2T0H1_CERRI|nr:hypothetical protein KP509_16G055100 [Ceratopteris richardii]
MFNIRLELVVLVACFMLISQAAGRHIRPSINTEVEGITKDAEDLAASVTDAARGTRMYSTAVPARYFLEKTELLKRQNDGKHTAVYQSDYAAAKTHPPDLHP